MFINIYVTQTSHTQLVAPIETGFTHVIFYNSTTMRISSLLNNVSAIIPRSLMKEHAAILKDASLDSVLRSRGRFFACIEKNKGTKFDIATIMKVHFLVDS